MVDQYKAIVISQLEAALCMLSECIRACPAEHWEDKIANGTFRWVAYHTLFFTDFYLSPREEAFQTRDLHARGGDELADEPAPGLSKEESLAYCELCREKIGPALQAETAESLAGPAGFSWRKITRAELHLYNLRHIQHHTGQLSAFLRKLNPNADDRQFLKWIGSGWRQS